MEFLKLRGTPLEHKLVLMLTESNISISCNWPAMAYFNVVLNAIEFAMCSGGEYRSLCDTRYAQESPEAIHKYLVVC